MSVGTVTAFNSLFSSEHNRANPIEVPPHQLGGASYGPCKVHLHHAGKKLVVLIGRRKALAMAVRNNRTENRFSGLLARLLIPG
jgi:hypothetical protein